MRTSIIAIGLLASTFLGAACGSQPSTEEKPSSFDIEEAREIVGSVNQSFGAFIEQEDSAGIAALYTSDAKLLAPNGRAVEGSSNISSAFAGMMKSGVGKAELRTVDLWGTESMLSEEGIYTLFGKDGSTVDKGKYIVLWKKEDGNWKLFRDIFNSDMAPAMVK